jgi:hypothetical protein
VGGSPTTAAITSVMSLGLNVDTGGGKRALGHVSPCLLSAMVVVLDEIPISRNRTFGREADFHKHASADLPELDVMRFCSRTQRVGACQISTL